MAQTNRSRKGSAMPTGDAKVDAYERLKDAILSGEIAPGTPLVESALASWFDVSRTPIREALTRLEQDALLARDKNGLVVRERTPGEILDIYDTRILLESAAARFAAERRTSHDILLLQRLVRRWDSVDQSDPRAMMAANREFHQTVWRASHNESLVDLLGRLDLHVARFPATTLSAPGRWEEAGREHARLVTALEHRDAAKAAEIASHHFQHARDIRLKLWDADI
jgi:DNA-binding GntR family transcriptional regulator